jgi:hypothetical protein
MTDVWPSLPGVIQWPLALGVVLVISWLLLVPLFIIAWVYAWWLALEPEARAMLPRCLWAAVRLRPVDPEFRALYSEAETTTRRRGKV